MKNTKTKCQEFFDNLEDPADNPVDDDEMQDEREIAHRRLNRALKKFDGAIAKYTNNTEADETNELRWLIYEAFQLVIKRTDEACETLEEDIPYIHNEWRYYDSKIQEKELESIEANESKLKKFFEKFPFEGHGDKINDFIKSIDADARKRIGQYLTTKKE